MAMGIMGKAALSKSWQESKLLWHIAFPAILTAVFQFSIGFVTVGFVGHIGSVELAAVTIVENVIEGFAYGVLVRAHHASIMQLRPNVPLSIGFSAKKTTHYLFILFHFIRKHSRRLWSD
jgi:MATE family multidrug resistance protein